MRYLFPVKGTRLHQSGKKLKYSFLSHWVRFFCFVSLGFSRRTFSPDLWIQPQVNIFLHLFIKYHYYLKHLNRNEKKIQRGYFLPLIPLWMGESCLMGWWFFPYPFISFSAPSDSTVCFLSYRCFSSFTHSSRFIGCVGKGSEVRFLFIPTSPSHFVL